MGKKMDRSEPKKECPSCGLGVALNANICEFCGWDFEEEDEWILQIEKLERELMMEKQKFEPGTVDHRIESTLRNPLPEREGPGEVSAVSEVEEAPAPQTAVDLVEREAPQPAQDEARVEQPAPAMAPEQPTKVRRVRTARAPPAAPEPAPVQTRRVRRPAVKPPEPEHAQPPTRKLRAVRRVKQ